MNIFTLSSDFLSEMHRSKMARMFLFSGAFIALFLNFNLAVAQAQSAPTLQSSTDTGLVEIPEGESFVWVIDADDFDGDLRELEIDHSLNNPEFPEFSVYASATNPYGSQEDADQFAAAGVTVTYDEGEQKWTLDFGANTTGSFIDADGITFYIVIHDVLENTWGSMYHSDDAEKDSYGDWLGEKNTFAYDLSRPIPLTFTSSKNGNGTASATTTSETTKTASSTQGDVKMTIPNGTVITSEDENWDGTIITPTVITATVAPSAENGFENPTEIVTIQVGTNDGTKLTFEQGVKLVFEGQTGNAVGWSRGGVFTPITTICSANSQVAGNELVAGGDCKISEGGDLIVWTKHFTDFTVYTQTAVATPASSGGGGSRAVAVSTEAEPQVLGITNSSESLVNSSQQLNIQNFTPILETMSAILTAIESGRISGEISDKDVKRLNNQLGQIISSLTSLLSTVL